MHNPKNLNSVRPRAVEHDYSFEARHTKNSQRCQARMLEPRMPSHLRLRGEESEGLMSSYEETMTDFGVRFRREVIGLVVEVLVCLRANGVVSIHRVSVFCRRSSSRRCFSSQ